MRQPFEGAASGITAQQGEESGSGCGFSQGRGCTACRILFPDWREEVDFSALNVQYPALSTEETLPSALLLCACDRMPPAVLEGSLVVPGLGEVETGSPISLELPGTFKSREKVDFSQ